MSTGSFPELMEASALDARAVDAIRAGDRERYRELVERHSRRVYAVAWSRLGDTHLAEEAAQETFIQGYRHLRYLRKGGSFATWITAIARNAAINLGLRHRRDLENRKRWTLEPCLTADDPTSAPADSPGPFTPDTLRNSLAQLPSIHRECLVLFYLENKSVAEAAATLSLSEGAFRTRLHRARGALREQLERELEGSLERLRPPGSFVQGVMVLLPGTTVSKLAGAGSLGGVGSWASSLVTKLPFASLLPIFFMMIGLVPALLFQRWLGRKEQGNFRDPNGFRARQHRDSTRRLWWTMPVVLLGISITSWMLNNLAGPRGACLGFAILVSAVLFSTVRANRLLGGPAWRLHAAGMLLTATGFWLTGLGVVSPSALGWFSAAAFIPLGFSARQYSPRMDLSLFLRADNQLLPDRGSPRPRHRRVTRQEQRGFARFLGSRQLVVDYRWRRDELDLCLAGIQSILVTPLPATSWGRASVLTLLPDGSVRSQLGASDARALRMTDPAAVAAIELRVEQALESAWSALRIQDPTAADRLIGQQQESEFFRIDPRQSQAGRWRIRMMGLTLVMLVVSQIIQWMAGVTGSRSPVPGAVLSPVAATSRDLAASLAPLATVPPPGPGRNGLGPEDPWISFHALLHAGVVWPSRESLGEAWPVTRAALWNTLIPTNTPPTARRDLLLSSLMLHTPAQRAFLSGWITKDELKREGVDRTTLREWWLNNAPSLGDHLGGLPMISVSNADYTVLDVSGLALRLQILQAFDQLNLVESGPIVATLRSHQVLPGNTLAGRRPLSSRSELHGLFWLGLEGPLRDTHSTLVILSTLGALNAIDRPSCIQGVLQLHRGEGLFGPPQRRSEVSIPGDARDTWAALESLGILAGLDQVPDLALWRFRPLESSLRTPDNRPRILRVWEIEAWAMTEALNTLLKSGNLPAAGSLLPATRDHQTPINAPQE